MKHRAHRSGFMLIEMLITLALFSVFAAAATPLLRNTLKLTWQAETEHNRILQAESLMQALRQDVWNTSRIESTDQGIRLRGEDQTVRWTIAGETIERNSEGDSSKLSPRRWSMSEFRLEMRPTTAGLDLLIRNARDEVLEQSHLTSQLMLLNPGSRP